MVLSALLNFNASAITYVGNYTGPCLIQLNGEAILIKLHTGVIINKWPYNCIRQFRAEDETGKFSFLSGRRGPYGVAEYNFSLPDDSLKPLQNALTNFTGVQFGSEAPGSGAEQQLLQPLPPYPPTHLHHTYSMSDNYQMANPKHVIGGNRSDSITSSSSGDFQNTITYHLHSQKHPIPASGSMSPTIDHFQVPKLPPRNYTLTNLRATRPVISKQSSQFSSSMDEVTLRLQHKERPLTLSSPSSLSRTSTSASDTGRWDFNAPTLLPKDGQEPAETWVAKGSIYNKVNAQNLHLTKGNNLSRSRTVTSRASFFGTPQKKKLFDHSRRLIGSETTTESEIKEDETNPDNVKKNSAFESSKDVINFSRSPADQDKLQTNVQKKDSNYDHLQGWKEIAEYSTPNQEAEPPVSSSWSISPDIIPMMSSWKKSPCNDDEIIDLQRSSPTVKVHSTTPENTQKIRCRAKLGELFHGRNLTILRVSSEGSIGSHKSPSPPNFTPTTVDKHESAERQFSPTTGQIRSTRSLESLPKIRAKSLLPSGFPAVEDRRRGKPSPVIFRGMNVDIDLKSSGIYEDIDLEREWTPAKNAPLPSLHTLGAPPAAAMFTDEGMYCEISDAVIVNNRKPAPTKQSTTEELSAADEVQPFARPKYPDPSISAMYGMDKAKKLSEEGGYEFCTPAPQHLRQEQPESGRTHGMWVTQQMGLESSRTALTRFCPFSECNQHKVAAANPALLGTHTHTGSNHLGDKYVIVTGTDRQMKLGSDSPISTEADMTGTIAEDEYEVMTSEHIQQHIQFQSCYSTPDPKLYSNYAPNDTRLSSSSSSSSSSSTQFGGPIGRRVSDEYFHSLPPRGPDTEESEFAGINIDSINPSDSDIQPVYFNVLQLGQSSSTSLPRRNNDCNEEGGVDVGKNGHGEGVEESIAIQISDRAAMVKTLEGSPLDVHESAQLKNLACSLANFLVEGTTSEPSLLITISAQTSRSPSSTLLPAQTTSTTSSNKRNHYINCTLKEDEEVPNSPTRERPTLKNKQPQPLPRRLLRVKSVPT